MKKIVICLILIISQNIIVNCDLTTSINYSHDPFEDYLLASIDFGRSTSIKTYGVYDGFRKCDLASGIRIKNEKISYAYDFAIFSYLAIYRLPLKPIFNTQENPNMDDHELNDGPTYLTFSYKGPELSNVGIYEKDYNWSSVGIDFLYKKFNGLKGNEFYSRFSYIITVSTIKNNMDYFADMNITNKTQHCLDMKIKNSTNLLIPYYHSSELMLESYYRMILNDSKQKELGINLKYGYHGLYPLNIYSQVGYIRYGSNDNWKNLFKCGIGMSYAIIQGPYKFIHIYNKLHEKK